MELGDERGVAVEGPVGPGGPLPLAAGVVKHLAPGRQPGGEAEGFRQGEAAVALAVDRGIHPDRERQPVVDPGQGAIFRLLLIGETRAGKGLEVEVEVALVQGVHLILGLVHTLPADLPGELQVILGIHPGEQAFTHMALHGGGAPNVGHVVRVLAEAGSVAEAVVGRIHRGPAGGCVAGGNLGCRWRCAHGRFITEHPRHAAHHVVEDVAVEHPVLVLVRLELDQAAAHRRHVDGVLER